MSLHISRRKLVLILLCLFMLGMKKPDHLEGLPTLEDFAWQLADDPQSAYLWTSKAFEALTPDTPISRKVRVSSFFIQATVAVEKLEFLTKHIQFFKEHWLKAADLSLNKDRTAIGKSLLFYYLRRDELAKSEELFTQTIDEARRFHDYDILIETLVQYGDRLEDRGQKTQALRYIHEAYSMAGDKSLKISPLNRHAVRIMTALSLQRAGSSGLDSIIDDSMKYLMDKRPRQILAIFAFRVAMELRDKDASKALMYFDVTLREARSIGDKVGISATLAEQAEIAFGLKRYQEAERKAFEAANTIGST